MSSSGKGEQRKAVARKKNLHAVLVQEANIGSCHQHRVEEKVQGSTRETVASQSQVVGLRGRRLEPRWNHIQFRQELQAFVGTPGRWQGS